MFKLQTSWYKAFQHCRYLGMNLISISSQEENDRIEQQIQDEGNKCSNTELLDFNNLISIVFSGHDDKDFWTSGTKLGNGQTYNWMGNGKLVQYSNWALGQPDNHLWGDEYENCINIIYKKAGRDGLKWNDATCESNFHFICEQEQVECEYCSSL